MKKNVLSIFDSHVGTAINRELVKNVVSHTVGFTRKNENHIHFFGGNLIGVYPVKWLPAEDGVIWLEDVLKISDVEEVKNDISELPAIVEDRHVSTDIVNLSYLWVAHKALSSKILSADERDKLAANAIKMFHYKAISSIHTQNFRYKADEEIALATYEGLDNKSQLKKYESWYALVDNRANVVLDKNKSSYATLMDFTDDEQIVLLVNALWNSVKSILKLITRDFHDIKDAKTRVEARNMFVTIEGKVLLKDSVNKYSQIRSVIHMVIPDTNAFIRNDLIHVITTTVNTVSPHYLETSLKFISHNYTSPKKKDELMLIVDDLIQYVFDIARTNKIDVENIPQMALKLKSLFRASKNASELFLSIKERISEVIMDASPHIDNGSLASTRIGLMLYISLRALLK